MTGALAPRLVLVTRESEYEGLLARHATRGQAEAFVRRRGQSLDGLDDARARVGAALAEIRAALPRGWRVAAVRRAELDRFLFGPEDVVVAVGQDGLVANVAKYLRDQPVIGVNADPARGAGILVPHTAAAAAAMLPLAAAGALRTEARTMIRAELDDGQALLALNEVFVGHAGHQSARYSLRHAGREEAQSSSGVIVASGTGATGWALSIARATGVAVELRPEEAAAVFLVREPWPSRATGTALVHGRLENGDGLLIASRMNEGGVVFADGIETDRLEFNWGRTLRVSVAEQRLRFVPGDAPPAAAPAARARAGARTAARRETGRGAGPGAGAADPAGTHSPGADPGVAGPWAVPRGAGIASPPLWRRRGAWALVGGLVLALSLPRACALLNPPSSGKPAALPDRGAAPTAGAETAAARKPSR